MSPKKLFLVLLLLFTPIIATPLFADNGSTTQYTIIQNAPSPRQNPSLFTRVVNMDLVNDIADRLIDSIDEKTTNLLEEYVEKVAREYAAQGFKAPALDGTIEGTGAHPIYVYDYPDKGTPTALYSVRCEKMKTSRYIAVDSSRVMINGKINSKVYEDLAHELFHAIQGSYALFNEHCNLGDWIAEGTATAVGIDMAKSINNTPVKQWGQRTYSAPLRVPDLENGFESQYSSQEGHRTQGLWRYFGEYISEGGVPGVVQGKAPDYRYLTKLFDLDIQGKSSEEKELRWLDVFLKSNASGIGRGLDEIYPLFITTFAHYMPTRSNNKAKESVKPWQKCLFVEGLDCRKPADFNALRIGCEKVNFSSALTEYKTYATSFEKVSARCFEVFYDGPANELDIQIVIESNDNQLLSSIKTIGMETNPDNGLSKKIKLLNSQTATFDDYPNVGVWEFAVNIKGRKSVIFVVSNVAQDASKTKAYNDNEKVQFSFSYYVNSGRVDL